MRFITPIGYSTICKGELIYSSKGFIDTYDKTLIDQLSQSNNVKQESNASQKTAKQEKGA
jgi:hypothetical protein